jgi:hypothetical protein
MAERTIWSVQFTGGLDTTYSVLGGNPFQAAGRGWDLDKQHKDHAVRDTILVKVSGKFNDNENDIPTSAEDLLRAQVTALDTRLKAVEAKVP